PQLFSLSVRGLDSGDTVLPPGVPGLRQLTLIYFALWPTGYFHDLTHLALCSQPYPDRPSTLIFLDFIEHSPLLEVITL
ncbi:hypothetical protein C8J56DRAFT_765491, partial [Mycena floridula]